MTQPAKKLNTQTGAELLVRSLEAQGVKYVFGIPGAKIDKVFDTLLDSKIETVVCRHEQNAAFIAGGIGRMTGKAGVALVTSGPGCSNLVTGLATANSEGDPVVAVGGAVTRSNRSSPAWLSPPHIRYLPIGISLENSLAVGRYSHPDVLVECSFRTAGSSGVAC